MNGPFCVSLHPSGLNLLRNFDGDFEDDIIYSDEDDGDDDEDYSEHFSSPNAPPRTLEPHPRIRQLTEEVIHCSFIYMEMKHEASPCLLLIRVYDGTGKPE